MKPQQLLISIFIVLCSFTSFAHAAKLVDQNATPETKALYDRLQALQSRGVMFGQQDATTNGVGWTNYGSDFCGDVCKVSGFHPAVYGADLSDVFGKAESDKENLRTKMRQVYEEGGINTFSWHMLNPVTGGSFKDLTPACSRILPGGDKNELFLSWLDQLADFFDKLKTKDGKQIPVIFRPWHEANEFWFWWGHSACQPDDLKTIWAMTVKRLRDDRHIHQLLWEFSPNWFPDDGMIDYPGDDYVDIMGLDFYFFSPTAFFQKSMFKNQLLDLVNRAHEKNKLAALAEIGYEKIPDSNWWTDVYWDTLKSQGIMGNLSYGMFWRNNSTDHFYVPYPGHASAPDFVKMASDPSVLFLERIK